MAKKMLKKAQTGKTVKTDSINYSQALKKDKDYADVYGNKSIIALGKKINPVAAKDWKTAQDSLQSISSRRNIPLSDLRKPIKKTGGTVKKYQSGGKTTTPKNKTVRLREDSKDYLTKIKTDNKGDVSSIKVRRTVKGLLTGAPKPSMMKKGGAIKKYQPGGAKLKQAVTDSTQARSSYDREYNKRLNDPNSEPFTKERLEFYQRKFDKPEEIRSKIPVKKSSGATKKYQPGGGTAFQAYLKNVKGSTPSDTLGVNDPRTKAFVFAPSSDNKKNAQAAAFQKTYGDVSGESWANDSSVNEKDFRVPQTKKTVKDYTKSVKGNTNKAYTDYSNIEYRKKGGAVKKYQTGGGTAGVRNTYPTASNKSYPTKTPAPAFKKGGAKNPGFKAVQASIAKKSGVSTKAAGAILASASRKASPAAKRANPKLKKVKR